MTHPSKSPPLGAQALLNRYGLRPDRSLGQNFLVDEAALSSVVRAAEISKQDEVLEIGPGLGSLTRHLAQAAKHVIAVEIDQRLIPPLHEILSPYPNVRIIAGDILALPPADLVAESGYLVVANIPYYITSALLRHLLEAQPRPSRMVMTVQREVAKRICAAPGKMSLLALSVQVYGHPAIQAYLPAGAFYPPPKVDSAVIRVDLYAEPIIPSPDLNVFFHLLKAGFSQKRKTLKNSLSGGLALEKDEAGALLKQAGIEPERRAETLSLEEWKTLVEVYREQY